MSSRTFCWLILFSSTLLCCSYASAGIMNGDFSDTNGSPFANWTTLYGDEPTDGGGVAVFSTTDFFQDSQLEQSFLLPSGATTLSFDFYLSSVAGGSGGGFLDSFQVSLFDSLGDPILQIDPANPFDPRFFGFDSGGNEIKSSGVSVFPAPAMLNTWTRVSLDVSSLSPQQLTIEFLLLGDDDELTTTVLLDNVVVNQSVGAVPEPATIAIWALFTTATLSRRRRVA